ncbi:unnamed protein product [Lathyrus sativus]|nr:unnamed protein product [Lathyrus sativus]
MEHYALTLQCSPILSPLSYSSKSYENRKFHLRLNQTTLCIPRVTTSHNVTRSISHANCMHNSFSVPNSKTIEKSDNNILRGINGVSIVLGCILGMFNFNSKMMNSKFNTAYAIIDPNVEPLSGGASSFGSLWNSMNAELIDSDIKFNSPPTPDNRKKHALYLRKTGKRDKVEEKLNELRTEYMNSKDEYSTIYIERSVRSSFMELLLIQGHFEEARKLLDDEIDNLVNPKRSKVKSEKKINQLLDIYNKEKVDHDKQAIADIIFYKAIIHIMLKDNNEAAKWWEAFAKTLPKEAPNKEIHFPWSM